MNKPIKIAIFVNGGIGGGFENQGVPALTQLVFDLGSNHELTVFSMVDVPDYHPSDFKFVSIKSGFQAGFLSKITAGIRTFKPFFREKEPFDMIHAFGGLPAGFMAALFSKFYRIPLLVTMLGGEAAAVKEINYGHLLKWKNRMLLKWVCKKADQIIFLTHYQRKLFTDKIKINSQVSVVPFGADLDKFKYTEKSLSKPYKFIHIANLTSVKGQRTMLDVFEKINRQYPSELTIAGDGELRNELENYSKKLGLTHAVTFAGAVNHNQLPKLLQESHFLIHNSLFEGQGVVFAEAASCGTVICSTNVGLASDLGNEAAIVSETNELADKIIEVIINSERYSLLQKNAHHWAVANTSAETVASYRKLYSNIIGS